MNAILDDRGQVEAAISCIPADLDRDEWWRIGAALKHHFGDDGFFLFDQWSQGGKSYAEADARDTWKSLKSDGGITIGTLFAMAKEHGYDRSDAARVLVSAEAVEQRRAERIEQAQKDEKTRQANAKHAATLALAIWEKSVPAGVDHPYLDHKGIGAPGTLREIAIDKLSRLIRYHPAAGGEQLSGRILIAPVRVDGKLSTVEMIDEDGRKSALRGGIKSGGYWTAFIGEEPKRILIAEGVATAESAYLCTGESTVAALSSGNLLKVAEAMHSSYPDAEIVVLSDVGNGEEKARDAARAVGGKLALPIPEGGARDDVSDFNDAHLCLGSAAVQSMIAAAVTPPTVEPEFESAAAGANDGCVPAGFNVTDRGVFYAEDDGTPHWISSTLHVRALVRDRASENWGRLLEWEDADGYPHVWAMPMEMLRSDGADMRGELARLGLDIAPGNKARNKLSEYVVTAKPKARGRCVTRTGWHGGAFVFPDRTIGQPKERVIFQAEAVMRTYSQAGTLDEWRQNIARLCSGNSRLLLAVSTAFAGMMLNYSGQESGGLNIVGDSSTGKTTALRAACSVFGGPEYMQRWRATSNGLEGLATLHNDTLLVLDELAQVDPREAGEIAYMLANGSGKARAGRSGAARAKQTWRLLFLSAGEIGLAQHMQAGGKKAKAGQEVRLVEIPADAGAGYGLFETLHGMEGGAQLSSAINDACSRDFGSPAIAFLEALTHETADIETWLKTQTTAFLQDNLPADASGQAHRVCQRFALIGLAGEYATGCGITGWATDEALQGAAACFSAWLEGRGGAGNQEQDATLAQVKAFFESHEEARFSELNTDTDRPTINRAGYKRTVEGSVEFLVFPEVFRREICTGLDPKAVAKTLVEANWLRRSADGRSLRAERLPGKGPTKVYVFTANIWGEKQ